MIIPPNMQLDGFSKCVAKLQGKIHVLSSSSTHLEFDMNSVPFPCDKLPDYFYSCQILRGWLCDQSINFERC